MLFTCSRRKISALRNQIFSNVRTIGVVYIPQVLQSFILWYPPNLYNYSLHALHNITLRNPAFLNHIPESCKTPTDASNPKNQIKVNTTEMALKDCILSHKGIAIYWPWFCFWNIARKSHTASIWIPLTCIRKFKLSFWMNTYKAYHLNLYSRCPPASYSPTFLQ